MHTRPILVVAAIVLAACNAQPPQDSTKVADQPRPAEGRLAVPGGNIWYYISGTNTTATPVILLHGGPGFSSFYMKPLEQLADDRTVVRYDQLGGGKSDVVTDSTLFTIAHFVAELDSLRRYLGYDRVHLLGHSWGTILGVEYYRAHPEHVASLILSSPALDIPAWERNARQLLTTLSDSAQRAVRVREAAQQYDAPDYQQAVEEYYGKYYWATPIAADLDSSMSTFNTDIYYYMQGPSEFTISGTLKSYDATPFLNQVRVPVLYTVGELDSSNPEIVKRHAALTPGASAVVIPGARHVTTWDNPDVHVKVVRDFLRELDR